MHRDRCGIENLKTSAETLQETAAVRSQFKWKAHSLVLLLLCPLHAGSSGILYLFIYLFLQDAEKECLTREKWSSAGIRLIWSGEVRGERVVRGVRGEGNVSQAL